MPAKPLLAATALTAALTLTACASSEAPQAAGRPWHHLADGTFRNPPGSPPREAGFTDFVPFFAGQFVRSFSKVEVPDGHVLSADEVRAGRERHHNGDHVTWLGHAAFLIRLNGATILTDPYLSRTAGPFGFGPKRYVPPALTVEELPPIDLLLVSHNHYDHLDADTVEALPGKDRMTVIVPLGLGEFFRRRGYSDVRELDWYDRLEQHGVAVTLTPAVHFSRRGPFDMNRTLWAGFSLAGLNQGGKKLYFSGDTAYGAVFREIGEKLGPFDLGLIGVGAYEPQIIMKSSHATPEEALRMMQDVRAASMIGMHWGTVVLTEEPQFEVPERLAAAAAAAGLPPGQAGTMRIGETRGF